MLRIFVDRPYPSFLLIFEGTLVFLSWCVEGLVSTQHWGCLPDYGKDIITIGEANDPGFIF